MGELFKKPKAKEAFEKLISFINGIYNKLSPYSIYIASAISLMVFPNFSIPIIIVDILKGVLTSILSDNFIKFFNNEKFDEEKLKKEIEEIHRKIEKIANQNIEIDRKINESVEKILKDESFIKLFEELRINIENLKNELLQKILEIQKEINIIKEIKLPKIDDALQRGIEPFTKPELFRNQGPLWVDFENGFVYKPSEVDEIIKRLKNENLIVIKGKPASGKTSILRYIGYELSKNNWDVYYIELKTFQEERLLEINKLSHGLIIIDDANLKIELIEDILKNRPKAKLIIGSRDIDIEKIKGPTFPSIFSEYLKSAIEIEAKNYTDELIKIFEEKKNIKVNDEIKQKLNKNNLWILVWQLKTYEKYGNVEENTFYKTIKEYIENISKENIVENALMPLSFFYSYQTQIKKSYLIEFCSLKIINDLIASNEIVSYIKDNDEYLAFHHSEVAKIFFNTFKKFNDFGCVIKKEIENKLEDYKINTDSDYKQELFFLIDYTIKYPKEFNNWIYLIDEDLQDELLKNEKFQENISNIFKKMESFNNRCFLFIYEIKLIKLIKDNINLKNNINKIEISNFEKKIKEWKKLVNIANLLNTLHKIGYSGFTELIEKFEVKFFEEKIGWSDDPRDIAYLLETLKEIDYSGFTDLKEKFEVNFFEEKIRWSEDPRGIAYFLKTLYNIGYSKLNKINVTIFEEKIRGSEYLWGIAKLLDTLHNIGYSKLNELKEKFEVKLFEEKIRGSEDPRGIDYLLNTLHKIEYSGFTELIEKFEVKFFEEMIRGWKDPSDIAYLLETLHKIGYSRFNELIEKFEVKFFEEKIRGSKVPWDIAYLLETLHKIGYSKLNKINVTIFEEKVSGLEDLGHITHLLETLHKIGYSKLNKINVTIFEEKVRRLEDLSHIIYLLETLHNIDYSRFNELIEKFEVKFFEEKIRGSEYLLGIANLLNTLHNIDYSRFNELKEKFEVKFFEEKIRESEYLLGIANLLNTLHNIDYSGFTELKEKFEVKFFEEKIRELEDPSGIADLLETLHKIGYSGFTELIEKFEVKFFEEKIRGLKDPTDIANLLETLKKIGYSKLNELIERIKYRIF